MQIWNYKWNINQNTKNRQKTKVYINIISNFLSLLTDCESLIRKMLVLDPSKRYTVDQIKRHRWMTEEAPRLLPSTGDHKQAEPNEQILRLLQSLGIDPPKTRDVSQTLNYLLKFYQTILNLLCTNTHQYTLE